MTIIEKAPVLHTSDNERGSYAAPAYVFRRSGSNKTWRRDAKLIVSEFGKQVSLSSEYAVGGFISDDYMSSERGFFVVIANVSSIP